MEKIDSFTAKADLTHFISLALQKELSWNALAIVLDGFKLSNEQYRYILKFLLKELEQLQEQLQSKDNQVSEAEYTNSSSERSKRNSEIETDVKLEDEDLSIQESEDAKCDTENHEDESMPIGLEIEYKEVIDNEHYPFVNESTADEFDDYRKQNIDSLKTDEHSSSDPLLIENKNSNKANASNNRRKFHCVICTSDFTHESNLIRHERIHSGEKSFNCKTCPRSFTRSTSLRMHEIIHTGKKPFQCKVCKKSFSRDSNLKRHETIHIEESGRPKLGVGRIKARLGSSSARY